MKTALALLLLISLACHSHARICYTCDLGTENECNNYGSSKTCPGGRNGCATLTGTGTVHKFCADSASCSSTPKVTCCYSDNCNAPGKTSGASGGPQVSRPILLLTALLLGVTLTRL